MSENGAGVYGKIAEVMRQVDRIPKRGRNDFHGYDYVLEADLVEHLRPLMIEAGLIMVPSQRERVTRQVETSSGETTVTEIHHVFTIIDTEDGSSVEIPVWGAGADGQDKGPYKAFTGAQKYALMKGFMVATGDDPEHDTGYTKQARPPKRQQQSSGAEAGGLSCPDCGGPVWDNTEDEKSAANGGKRPNFKCKDKECDWATWDSRAETFGAEPEGEDEQVPVNEHRAKLREWFFDAYGEDAGQRMAEFVINCPGVPSNPDKLDPFHLSQMWDLIREHGTDAAEDPKAFVGEQQELV